MTAAPLMGLTREQIAAAPLRDASLLPVDIEARREADGTLYLQSCIPLAPYDFNLPRRFAEGAARQGDKAAIARRAPGGGDWIKVSYAQLKRDCDGFTQWLLDLKVQGTVLLVSSNSSLFSTVTYGGWASGRPVCPASPMMVALGGDLGRLRHVVNKAKPAVIVAETAAIAAAFAKIDTGNAIIVCGEDVEGTTTFASVITTEPTDAVAASIEGLKPDTVSAYMLTSGSTGLPKLVELTIGALGANTAQCQQTVGKAAGWSDVMMDWLPWHHAAGAFAMRTTLLEGGTFYIDDGKPMPGLFDQSIRNLTEVSVGYYNNVPLGYVMLADALEADPALRKTFFERVRMMLFGGAGLTQAVFDRLQACAVSECGHRVMLTSGYGSTETGSAITVTHYETDKVGLGLPVPGCILKLVPVGDRYELRAAGPSLSNGYLDEPEKTAEAFDEEGFYRSGDLCVFHDPERPELGLAFAGRAAEEFKLLNGNWVYGGHLREQILKHLDPLALDLVLCDENRPYLTAIIWTKTPNAEAEIAERLKAFNADQSGGNRIRRILFPTTPPNPNAHELSDKGTVNRRAVLDNRKDLVERLFADQPDEGVIILEAAK